MYVILPYLLGPRAMPGHMLWQAGSLGVAHIGKGPSIGFSSLEAKDNVNDALHWPSPDVMHVPWDTGDYVIAYKLYTIPPLWCL